VFIDETIHRNGRVYFRCHADETVHQRALEIPDWMFESSCSTIGAVATPIVSSDALRDLQVLLANASGYDPILKEARCFEGGADAKETGSKTVSTWAVSAGNTDAHVEGNATGGAAEDDRADVAIASPTSRRTAQRAPVQGGRP